MDMDREAYLLGRAALKTKIKALAFVQKRDKAVLRVTRKLTKTQEDKAAARKAAGYKPGDEGPTTWECTKRRMQITAYLNVYAKIRNAVPHALPDWYYMHTYQTFREEAEALFDQATKAESVA